MEYFTERAKSYNYAVNKYPNILKNELRTAANMCDLQDGERILNIPGACVDITPYIKKQVDYKAFEINKKFAELTNLPICTLAEVPVPTGSADKVLSLAALHHCSEEERAIFYAEVRRILKPDGTFILGDVLRGSVVDDWLNIFVNAHNPIGHNGLFFNEADVDLLAAAGFSVTTTIKRYRWDFENQAAMIDFCRHLFGIVADDVTLLNGLTHYLGATDTGFDWELIYFIAKVSPTPSPLSLNKV